MAAIYIGLSVSCSLLIAHFLKLSEHRNLRIIPVLIVNYIVATSVAMMSNISGGYGVIPDFSYGIWFLAFVVGVFFILNFLVYSQSIHFNGVGTSITAMRMSLLIPILLSIVWYGEVVTVQRLAGILLVFTALFLLVRARHSIAHQQTGKVWYLIVLFILTGTSEAALKIFQMEGMAEATEAHFMFAVFGTSMITGLLMAWKSGIRKVTRPELFMGILIGVPNLFTAIFLLKALQVADGTLVYSAVNVLLVSGGAVLGFAYWKDKVTIMQIAGMITAIIAILLVM